MATRPGMAFSLQRADYGRWAAMDMGAIRNILPELNSPKLRRLVLGPDL